MVRFLLSVLGIALLWPAIPAAGQATATSASPAAAPPRTGATQVDAVSRLAKEFYIPGYYEPKPNGGYTWHEGFWAPRQKDWRWIPAGWVYRNKTWTFRKGYWVSTRSRMSLGGTLGPVADVQYLSEIRPGPGLNVVPVGIPLGELESAAPVEAGAPRSRYLTELPPGTQFREVNAVSPFAPQPYGGLAPSYYVGNSLPGTSYPSFAAQPAGIPGQSTYVGSSLPGTSYPSLATQPTAVPGQSYYVGNALPGTSYPSLVPAGTSVGGYGYGNSAPGSSGGQIGGGFSGGGFSGGMSGGGMAGASAGNGLPSP